MYSSESRIPYPDALMERAFGAAMHYIHSQTAGRDLGSVGASRASDPRLFAALLLSVQTKDQARAVPLRVAASMATPSTEENENEKEAFERMLTHFGSLLPYRKGLKEGPVLEPEEVDQDARYADTLAGLLEQLVQTAKARPGETSAVTAAAEEVLGLVEMSPAVGEYVARHLPDVPAALVHVPAGEAEGEAEEEQGVEEALGTEISPAGLAAAWLCSLVRYRHETGQDPERDAVLAVVPELLLRLL